MGEGDRVSETPPIDWDRVAKSMADSTDEQSASEDNGWQPSATAPRDGTTILVWHDLFGYVLVLWFPDGVGSFDNEGCDTNWKLDWEKSYLCSEPRYWTPLPAPPEGGTP
jgi:hypothetical protein